MKMIIHDLDPAVFNTLMLQVTQQDTIVLTDNGHMKPCIGCFGCWIKTPGICVRKDGYENLGKMLSQCDEVTIISKCIYGSYSPFIRNVLDRSIPYLLPYFTLKNGETHHQRRYNHSFAFTVHFYGEDLTEAERETAKELVAANGVNFYSSKEKVFFYDRMESMKGALG